MTSSSLGIKTSSKDISYALNMDGNKKIITHHFNIEPTLPIGKKLLLVKIDLINFLTSHNLFIDNIVKIKYVHIKGCEMNAMTVNPDRIMINGTLLQFFTEYGAESITSMNKANIQKILKKINEISILFPEKKVKYDLLFKDKLIFQQFIDHFLPEHDFSPCSNANTREAGINCIIASC